MGRFLSILSFLLLAVAVSHAALPAQIYWNKVLPNTPMPSTIRDLLHPDHKEKTVVVNEDVSNVVEGYKARNAGTEAQIHDDRVATLFFLQKDLHPGAKKVLHFVRTTSAVTFLPRPEANAIPFSSTKLPEILTRFSVASDTLEAEAMKGTLQQCEATAINGETEYCATSLESMVDFSTSSLGTRNVRAVSTPVGKEGLPKQQYTIAPSGVRSMAGSKVVSCHAEPYPYAVFYCHATSMTTAYTVALVGKDGMAVKAVAVCHTDTANWNPRHVAFQVLKVKPGTVPICHFLPQGHVVWSTNN